jgi:chromosome segregation ATPase
MNEPLTLEGDIRYLKEHIVTKDRQLAEANLRIDIYKETWQDAEKDNTRLRQKLDEMHQLAMTRLNDNMGLAQENERLKVELEASRGQIRNQLGIILDLRKEKETLIGDRTSLFEEANELYAKLGRISTIIDEIVD